MALSKDNYIVKPLLRIKDLEILVKYLEGDTDFETLDRIEKITEGLKDSLDYAKREIQESDP